MNENLPQFISNSVNEATNLMLNQKQSFNPTIFIDLIVYNLLASIAYGKKSVVFQILFFLFIFMFQI